jgi:opacity protein-like surface antigen
MLAVATALASTATTTFAADLPQPLPPMPQYIQPAPIVEASGWYLRGDIGTSIEQLKSVSHPTFATAPQFTFLDKGGFDATPFFLAAVGYQWNNWFRFDVSAEVRGPAGFHAMDRFFNTGMGAFNTNMYTASKSERVLLANFFLDLGTWWCVTPFVGAGIGVTQNRIEHFRDVNVIAGGGGWADTGTKTNMAWSVQAGAAYKVTPTFSVELSYRFLNLGKAVSGTLVNQDPTVVSGNPSAPVTFNSIVSHDFMLGVRWMFQSEPVAPPIYAPPPLMRRG